MAGDFSSFAGVHEYHKFLVETFGGTSTVFVVVVVHFGQCGEFFAMAVGLSGPEVFYDLIW